MKVKGRLVEEKRPEVPGLGELALRRGTDLQGLALKHLHQY